MHLVVLPLPIIVAPVLIKKFSPPIPDPIFLVALIAAASFILLHHELNLFFVLLIVWLLGLVGSLLIHLYNCGIVFLMVDADWCLRGHFKSGWRCRDFFIIMLEAIFLFRIVFFFIVYQFRNDGLFAWRLFFWIVGLLQVFGDCVDRWSTAYFIGNFYIFVLSANKRLGWGFKLNSGCLSLYRVSRVIACFSRGDDRFS